MNKFEDDEDGIYDQVRRQLVKMAEDSNRIMDGRRLGKTDWPNPWGFMMARRQELEAHVA